MQIRNVMKRVALFALVACMVFAFFGCKKEETGPKVIFEKQVENWGYYFQQGVPDDWDFVQNENKMLNTNTGLCFRAFPKADQDNVSFSIYSYYHGKVVVSVEDFANWTMDSENAIYFNSYFLSDTDEVRDTYIASEKSEIQNYNKIASRSVTYTFVKDGEDWKGVYNVLGSGPNDLIVISFEAKADVYDTYATQYTDMMKDFRLLSRQAR